MHIAYLASVRIPSEKASGLAIARQCEAFGKLGYSLTLFIPKRNKRSAETLFDHYSVIETFRVHSLPVIRFVVQLGLISFLLTRVSLMLTSFYAIVKNRSFQVVYSRDQWLLFLPLLFTKRKIIWEAHTAHKNAVTRYVAKRADRVVVISPGLQQYYREYTNRDDILLEPSGVNTKQFVDVPGKQVLRKDFGIPAEVTVVGYVGKYTTMGEAKGVDEIIEAFAAARKARPDLFLLLVGMSKNEQVQVTTVLEKYGIDKSRYLLLDLEQKKFAWYVRCADVLVMNYPDTEHYRLFMSPTKLFAYLASGLPVISSDLESVRLVVGESPQLTYVRPGDVGALSAVLQQADFNLLPDERYDVSRFSWGQRAERISKEF